MPANAVDATAKEAKGAADAASKLITDAQRTFGDTAKRLEKTMQESIEQLRAQSRVYAESAGEHLDDAQRYVSDRVKERPLAATGAALGIGVLIGLLLSSGRR